MPDTTLTSAVNELKTHQTQLDMDGVMVGVSRQALDIVLEALARAGLEAGKAEESMREALAPFAAVAEVDIGDSEADEDRFVPMSAMVARAPQITVGDMRRAAAAIRALPLTGVDKP